ncbi:MAG: ABC transporter substrate-binding protein [Peptococcaceae bacterium]|jgi:iron complex transport system substrate-binding protein|nr:ABC transporter substrate-binding protein [Peptococcaceae bacterium]
MKRTVLSIALIAALLLMLAGCASIEGPAVSTPDDSTSATRVIIDHNGDEVEIPTEINRVAVTTIYPLPAMLSMYLGSAEKLIGIHPVSMAAAKAGMLGKIYPELLNASTDWMQGDSLNIEELIKLKPDVVFYNAAQTAEAETLRNAGIPVIGVHSTKWKFDCIETFDKWVDLLNQVFPHQDRVVGVNAYAQEILSDIQTRIADIPENERVRAMFLFQYDDTVMITSGKNFFGQYWINSAGGINVAEELSEIGSNATINMEQVYAWNPDVIYITNFTPTEPADLYNNAVRSDDWSSVSAVKNQKVYKMPLGAYRSYTPGVDTPMTLLFMAKSLYPDKFADIDLTERVKSYYKDFFNITLTDEDVRAMYNPSADAGVAGFMNK